MSVESMYDWIEREDALNEIEKLKDNLGTQWLQDICMRNGLIYAQRCVKSLPTANRWIPVEDALPEKAGNYLCTLYYAIPPYHLLHPENDAYIREVSIQYFDGKSFIASVIAWMPMPDAYEPPNNMIGD